MKVSVIIPNYNGEKFLKVCIDSLYDQTFKDYKIIIVDNGSNDDSCKIVVENYPEVQLVKLNENFGFSRAVNEGIKIANSEYVVLLNNDTETDKEWLQNLVNCIEEDKKIFSCSSKMIQFYDRSKIDDVGDGYSILGWAYKRGENLSIDNYIDNKEVFSSCAGAAIYRRDVFDEIGYFDENFFAYREDVDIGYRARIFGYKNVFCCRAKIYHIGSGTSGGKHNSFKVKISSRNNVYLILKNMPIIQIIVNFPFLLIGFFVKFIYFHKKGLGKEFCDGIIEAYNKKGDIRRIVFRKENLLNYFKIELELIVNLFDFLFAKLA